MYITTESNGRLESREFREDFGWLSVSFLRIVWFRRIGTVCTTSTSQGTVWSLHIVALVKLRSRLENEVDTRVVPRSEYSICCTRIFIVCSFSIRISLILRCSLFIAKCSSIRSCSNENFDRIAWHTIEPVKLVRSIKVQNFSSPVFWYRKSR